MANPFRTKYDFPCEDCRKTFSAGNLAFHDGKKKYCPSCAESRGVICACGKYKKPDRRACYDCYVERKEFVPTDFS